MLRLVWCKWFDATLTWPYSGLYTVGSEPFSRPLFWYANASSSCTCTCSAEALRSSGGIDVLGLTQLWSVVVDWYVFICPDPEYRRQPQSRVLLHWALCMEQFATTIPTPTQQQSVTELLQIDWNASLRTTTKIIRSAAVAFFYGFCAATQVLRPYTYLHCTASPSSIPG